MNMLSGAASLFRLLRNTGTIAQKETSPPMCWTMNELQAVSYTVGLPSYLGPSRARRTAVLMEWWEVDAIQLNCSLTEHLRAVVWRPHRDIGFTRFSYAICRQQTGDVHLDYLRGEEATLAEAQAAAILAFRAGSRGEAVNDY